MIQGPGSRVSTPSFSANYYNSPLFGENYLGRFDTIFNYKHSIQAFGGFDLASFDLAATRPQMEDWFENGLGRMIKIFDDAGNIAWEGFVDKVTVADAGLEVSRGPLLESGNRVNLQYSSFDFNSGTAPGAPLPGIRKNTGFVNQTQPQEKYGIIYTLLASSGVTDANAVTLRDLYVQEHSEPFTSTSFSFMPSNPSLILDCKGYYHWFTNFPYDNPQQGEIDLSDKLLSIIQEDPNGYFSTNYTFITENTLQVPSWVINLPKSSAVLKGTIALGDSANQRYIFGVYEDRVIYYQPAPSEIAYHIHLNDETRSVYSDPGDNVVYPWAVRPGKWIKFVGFLPGLSFSEDQLRLDPRNLFIETVEFSAPNQLSFVGGPTDKFSQKLARLGLSGVTF